MAEVIDLTTNSDTEAAATSYTQTWHPPQQFPPLQFTSAPSIQLQTPHAAFEKAHHGLSIQPRSLPRAPSSTHRPISAVEHYRRQSAEQALRRKHSSRSISPEQSRKRQRLDPAILSSSPALQHRENGSPKSKDDGLQFLAAGEVRQSKTDICSSSPVPVEAGFTESKRDRRMRRSWKKIVLPSMREAFVPHLERLDKHIRREIQCKATDLIYPDFLQYTSVDGRLNGLQQGQLKLTSTTYITRRCKEVLQEQSRAAPMIDLQNGADEAQASAFQQGPSIENRDAANDTLEKSQPSPSNQPSQNDSGSLSDSRPRRRAAVVANYFDAKFYEERSLASNALASKDKTPQKVVQTSRPAEVCARDIAGPLQLTQQPAEVCARDIAGPARLTQEPAALAARHLNGLRTFNQLHLVGQSNIQRPYLCSRDRDAIRQMSFLPARSHMLEVHQTEALHVDFNQEEIAFVMEVIGNRLGKRASFERDEDPRTGLQRLIKDRPGEARRLASYILNVQHDRGILSEAGQSVLARAESSVEAFLTDAIQGGLSKQPILLRLQPSMISKSQPQGVESKLLLHRRILGDRAASGCRTFRTQITTNVEDTLVRRAEWSDCSGDINTIVWTPQGRFICGAIAHLDGHNMQYNKAGNMVFGVVSSHNVYSVADHRVPRPLVEKGANATQLMRDMSDPWLYSSVTSTAYKDGLVFTGCYDANVKIWRFNEGQEFGQESLNYIGQWKHSGHVNFVITSPHHRMIATAADIDTDAIRVYDLDSGGDELLSPRVDIYSGEKANELEQARKDDAQREWGYHVATLAFGQYSEVAHLLLAGYSPRTNSDADETVIPEERAQTGELCMWNIRTYAKVSILAAKSQNVFEVAWHPTQPIFIAATSPAGIYADDVRTQVRLFGGNNGFTEFQVLKTLDCSAKDINEITLKPTCHLDAYVTASCTDGATYVWDTGVSDRPIHILQHDESIETLDERFARDEVDVGVRFVSWGRTVDRLYTGSSDGVVKAWDVRAPRDHAFIREVLRLPGGIAAGAFSHDFQKLLIGDSTGKIHLLAVDGKDFPATDVQDEKPPFGISDAAWDGTTRIRKPIVPHKNDSSSSTDCAFQRSGAELARSYLERGQLIMSDNPLVGVVQGPAYKETEMFEAEIDIPVSEDLVRRQYCWSFSPAFGQFVRLPKAVSSGHEQHERNIVLERLERKRLGLSEHEFAVLQAEGVDFGFCP